MAWYALWKWFSPWRKTPYVNYIESYKQTLAQQWWDSLTPEEQEEERRLYQENKKRREENIARAWQSILNIYAGIANRAERW